MRTRLAWLCTIGVLFLIISVIPVAVAATSATLAPHERRVIYDADGTRHQDGECDDKSDDKRTGHTATKSEEKDKHSSSCRDEQRKYSISGQVIDSSSSAFDGAGITIRVIDANNRVVITGTDKRGRFRVSHLSAGGYIVSPSQEGYVFNPSERSITIRKENIDVPAFSRLVPTEGLSPEAAHRIDAEPSAQISPQTTILPNGKTLFDYAAERGFDLNSVNSGVASSSDSALRSSTAGTPTARASGAASRIAALPAVTGPQQKKNDVVMIMLASAQDFACGRANPPCLKWNYLADLTDPQNKPAQSGLTYVWGGKTPAVRTKPSDGCPQLTHGVDCSGLVSNVASAAGLSAPAGSAAQATPANWQVPVDWRLRMTAVTQGPMEAGDIIAWDGHVGIADSSSVVISSTGGPGLCTANINPPRGPRPLTVSQIGLGAPKAVLRLVADLSGDWDMYIRCTGQSTDAAVIRFTISNGGGGTFSATGSGTDYNGAPLSFTLNGNYDPASNIVTATLAFVDGTRSDSFTQKLLADDTGYFPMTKVIDNSGCFGSARLVRVSSATAASVSTSPAVTRSSASSSQAPPPSSLYGGKRSMAR